MNCEGERRRVRRERKNERVKEWLKE